MIIYNKILLIKWLKIKIKQFLLNQWPSLTIFLKFNQEIEWRQICHLIVFSLKQRKYQVSGLTLFDSFCIWFSNFPCSNSLIKWYFKMMILFKIYVGGRKDYLFQTGHISIWSYKFASLYKQLRLFQDHACTSSNTVLSLLSSSVSVPPPLQYVAT